MDDILLLPVLRVAVMSIVLVNTDSAIRIRQVNDLPQIDHVPAHVYTVRLDTETNEIVLRKDREKFNTPPKRYGKIDKHKNIIVDDFVSSHRPVGAIFTGLKGSGKSTLSEVICNAALARDIPVLLIDVFLPAELLKTLAAIISPCVFYFDEFGKRYSDEDRPKLLTFFSDTDLKQHLFLITGNERTEYNDYMIDRPQRFKYLIEFNPVDMNIIDEIIADYDLEPKVAKYIRGYANHHELNYDVLQYVTKAAVGIKDIAEFIDMIEILNVPAPVYNSYNLKNVVFDDNVYTERSNFRVSGAAGTELEITLLSETSEVLYEAKFDFDKVRKVDVTNDPRRWVGSFIIQVDERLRVEIDTSFTDTFHDTTNNHDGYVLSRKAEERRAMKKAENPSEENNTPKKGVLGSIYRDIAESMTERCLTDAGRNHLFGKSLSADFDG